MDVLELLRAGVNGGYNTFFSDAWLEYVSKQIATTVSISLYTLAYRHVHLYVYIISIVTKL